MKRIIQFISCYLMLITISACSFSSNTAEGVAVGGVVGAGGGAVIGAQSGNAAQGVAAGAAAGSMIGGLAGATVDAAEQEKVNQEKRDQLLEFQKREFDRQHREVEDLRRQQYHDREFKRKYGDR